MKIIHKPENANTAPSPFAQPKKLHTIELRKTEDGFEFDINDKQLENALYTSVFNESKRIVFFRLKMKIKRFFDLNEFIKRRTTWSNFKLKVLMLLNKVK